MAQEVQQGDADLDTLYANTYHRDFPALPPLLSGQSDMTANGVTKGQPKDFYDLLAARHQMRSRDSLLMTKEATIVEYGAAARRYNDLKMALLDSDYHKSFQNLTDLIQTEFKKVH